MIRANTLRTTVEIGGDCGCPVIVLDKLTNGWVSAAIPMLTGRGFTVFDAGTHWHIANPYIRSLEITTSIIGGTLLGRLVIVNKAGYDTLENEQTLNTPPPTRAPILYAQFVPKNGAIPTSKEYWQWGPSGAATGTFYLLDSPAFPGLTPWTPGGHSDNRVFPHKVFPITPELWASGGMAHQWQIRTKISGQLQHVGDLVTGPGGLASSPHHWYGNSVALVNSLLVKGSDGAWVFAKLGNVTRVDYRQILVTSIT